jgi:proteasome accessory factor C
VSGKRQAQETAQETAHEPATVRLARLLTMVPWLANRPGIHIAEAAAELGVSQAQLESDLNLLFMCGYGPMPDELIEVDREGGQIYIRNAETISRPLRLGRDEALTLMVGLRALAAVPGLTDRDAVDRAMAKLEDATSASVDASARLEVSIEEGVEAETLATAREALARRRRLHLRYLVPARDETTERDVDPMRVASIEGRWYLEGWCHRAQDTRLFRMDRIEEIRLLDEDGTPPPDAQLRDLSAGTFTARPDDLLVTLRLRPGALWVGDYYPVETRREEPGGGETVTLRTADTAWLRRLVWRLGGRAVVTDPQWVAAEVVEGARAALSGYAGEAT